MKEKIKYFQDENAEYYYGRIIFKSSGIIIFQYLTGVQYGWMTKYRFPNIELMKSTNPIEALRFTYLFPKEMEKQ